MHGGAASVYGISQSRLSIKSHRQEIGIVTSLFPER